MSDEGRVARLTELARRVWPEATIEVRGDYWEIRHRHSSMKGDDNYYQCVWTSPRQPERAADALEAALLVLAGESNSDAPLPEGPIGAAMDALRRSWWMEEEAAVRRMLIAWVEQLAQEWAEKAGRSSGPVRGTLLWAIDQLRERTKRGVP